MLIDGKIVSYQFGPQYDMDIRFSIAFQAQAGRSYDECGNLAQLVFQLLCHAVQQVQYAKEKNWKLEKIEETDRWEYPNIQAFLENKPVHVIYSMTYAKYQIKVDGRLVLALSESSDCDFLINYYDPTDDGWLDQFFDYAQKHCERFGRL